MLLTNMLVGAAAKPSRLLRAASGVRNGQGRLNCRGRDARAAQDSNSCFSFGRKRAFWLAAKHVWLNHISFQTGRSVLPCFEDPSAAPGNRVCCKAHMVMRCQVATFASMWITNVAAPVLCYSLLQPVLRTLPSGHSLGKALVLGILLYKF